MSTAKDILKATNTKVAKSGSFQGLKTHEVNQFLSQYKAQVSQLLPKGEGAGRILQVCANLVTKNDYLQECDAKSIIGAVMQAAELGFNPIQQLGHCYFVPYKGQVQMQVGYKGYIELARRSGKIKSLYAYCVYDGDDFSYTLGLNPDIQHIPDEQGDKDPASMTHVYAVAHYTDGGYNFVVMTRREVEKLRMRSPMQKSSPTGAWASDYDKMAMAKAIKQLARYMPLSDEMQTAVVADESVANLDAFEEGTGKVKLEEITYEIADDDDAAK